MSEADFVKEAIRLIGPVKKHDKLLDKECFIKIFKYTGDFAKLKGKEQKAKAQEERIQAFNKDHKKYLDLLKKTI